MVPRRYAWETRERAYHLWAGAGTRNASATRRLLRDEASPGAAVPTDRTIRNWVRAEAWTARADRDMGETRNLSLAEWQSRWLAVQLGRMDEVLHVLTALDDPTTEANRPRKR